jgi:hypothetical protein
VRSKKGALVRKEIANIENMFLEHSMNKDIESIVACVWEEIKQKHLPGMLKNLEPLKYAPIEIRRKAA